jgi:MSHA pilin protein MshD
MVCTVKPIGLRRERGFTLIEMVMALVVIGIAITGVLLAFQTVVRGSADPVIAQQLIAIAESMAEEVSLEPYVPQANVITSTGCSREGFNDVTDFNGYSTSGFVCAADGATLTGLTGYSISVSVAPATVSGVTMKLVTVVSSKGGDSFTLKFYKSDLS